MSSTEALQNPTFVSPLACWDLEHQGQKMKLLANEWSEGDEQFCHSFINRSVDERIAPKLADTLATLRNIKDFDPSLNEQVKYTLLNDSTHRRKFMDGMIQGRVKNAIREASISHRPKDRTEMYCTSMSECVITNIINATISNYRKRDPAVFTSTVMCSIH